MTARAYLDKCITALHLEASGSVCDEIKRAADAAIAEAAQTTSLVERATVIAAGMVTDPPVWEDNKGGKLARSAVAIALQIEEAAKPSSTGDAAIRDSVDGENPVRCEFHRVRHGADALIYEARFEMSGKALHVVPRADRERLLKIMIVDALDEAIKIEDL